MTYDAWKTTDPNPFTDELEPTAAEQADDAAAEAEAALEPEPEPAAPRRPLYLSGAIRHELVGLERLGFMRTPNMGNKSSLGMPWGADNGCFSSKGVRAFNLESYLGWLRAQDATTCLFATAPDRVGDAATTLELSAPVLPMLRALGYPAALVAQDGLEELTVPWDSFDVLFIGGSTEWKLGPAAAALVREAKRRGVWVHMGRVNSGRRYAYAAELGCDSTDGTFLAFGPTVNLPRLCAWVGVDVPMREAA